MIRVAINGYGNLGRGAEQAISKSDDVELVVVFTRRDPASVTTQGAPVAHVDDMAAWADKVDVCLTLTGHKPVTYPIAVATTGSNAAMGQAFVDFALSPEGQAILARYGFSKP